MHGYVPGSVVPTTELVLSHKHPEDRTPVQELLDRARHSGRSFSSRHRLLDTAGKVHNVIVVADRMVDEAGAVVGTAGDYIDLTTTLGRESTGGPRRGLTEGGRVAGIHRASQGRVDACLRHQH